MANVRVPAKVATRLIEQVPIYQRVLKEAKERGDNEANTGKIVVNMLSDVFGFDKFKDIDKEYPIEDLKCDVAVKIEGKVRYLVEIKAIRIVKLAGKHINQVVTYGAKKGIQWVVLTNGVDWQVYRIVLEGRGKNTKLTHELVCALNFMEMRAKTTKDQETLFMLCKRGVNKTLFEELYERQRVVNEHTIAALMMSDEVHKVIARELKKLEQNAKPDKEEIARIIKEQIITPLDFDDEKIKDAVKKIGRMQKKSAKEKAVRATNESEDE